MADKDTVSRLQAQVARVLAFNKNELISRPKWGEITFEDMRPQFERIFWIVNQLKTYPVDNLPNDVAATVVDRLNQVSSQLDQINQFNLQNGNPISTRKQLASYLSQHTDDLYSAGAQWIPFLAHQQGDVVRNIENLTRAVQEAEAMVTKSKEATVSRAKEIDEIIKAAREASAEAGAAEFTRDFQKIADTYDCASRQWLVAAMIAAIATLLVAGAMWIWTEPGLDQGQIFQKLSTKLFILALLLTGTLWCGKNYKALKHLATINRHRELSIRTLQAFAHAASDVHAKDAVLLEATRAVFGSVPTGYIDGAGNDGDLKVVEIARSVLPKSATA